MRDRARPAFLAAAVVAALLPASPVFAQAGSAAAVTRGPYLQSGTPESIVVRWRTDVPTDGRVWYGPAQGALDLVVDDAAITTEHTVTLTGLSPGTTYYYAVGTSADLLRGDDPEHFFVTSPPPAEPVPTRIWVLGDSGMANADAGAVRDAYEVFTGTRHTDLWLMLGDNAYYDGTDAQYQAAVFQTYPRMLRRSVLWPTLGNHDGHSADSTTQSGPYYDIFTLPKGGEAGGLPSGTEAFYSFEYGNIHFICLDSYDTDRSPGGAMLTWLRQDLVANERDWVVAFWHHAPYTKGSHDSDRETALVQMRQNVLPILERGGVDLVLAGHSHAYERSFLLDGHYGPSSTLTDQMKVDGGDGREDGAGAYVKTTPGTAPNEGTVYVVAGSSGLISGGPLNHPGMFLSLNSLGSLVLDFDRLRMDATFIDAGGAARDHFTIVKGSNHPPAASAGADVTVECDSPGGARVTLDGSGSSDPDSISGTNDDIVSYEWFLDYGLPSERVLGTGAVLETFLFLGGRAVTLLVTDRAGAIDTDEVLVSVVDTAPPWITVRLGPNALWPPSHRMIEVRASVVAADLCGPAAVTLVAVSSSEPDDGPGGGDGSTSNDIEGADLGTADFAFDLRAERDARGQGRTYVVTYRARDGSGNEATASSSVFVPHSLAGPGGGRRGDIDP